MIALEGLTCRAVIKKVNKNRIPFLVFGICQSFVNIALDAFSFGTIVGYSIVVCRNSHLIFIIHTLRINSLIDKLVIFNTIDCCFAVRQIFVHSAVIIGIFNIHTQIGHISDRSLFHIKRRFEVDRKLEIHADFEIFVIINHRYIFFIIRTRVSNGIALISHIFHRRIFYNLALRNKVHGIDRRLAVFAKSQSFYLQIYVRFT